MAAAKPKPVSEFVDDTKTRSGDEFAADATGAPASPDQVGAIPNYLHGGPNPQSRVAEYASSPPLVPRPKLGRPRLYAEGAAEHYKRIKREAREAKIADRLANEANEEQARKLARARGQHVPPKDNRGRKPRPIPPLPPPDGVPRDPRGLIAEVGEISIEVARQYGFTKEAIEVNRHNERRDIVLANGQDPTLVPIGGPPDLAYDKAMEEHSGLADKITVNVARKHPNPGMLKSYSHHEVPDWNRFLPRVRADIWDGTTQMCHCTIRVSGRMLSGFDFPLEEDLIQQRDYRRKRGLPPPQWCIDYPEQALPPQQTPQQQQQPQQQQHPQQHPQQQAPQQTQQYPQQYTQQQPWPQQSQPTQDGGGGTVVAVQIDRMQAAAARQEALIQAMREAQATETASLRETLSEVTRAMNFLAQGGTGASVPAATQAQAPAQREAPQPQIPDVPFILSTCAPGTKSYTPAGHKDPGPGYTWIPHPSFVSQQATPPSLDRSAVSQAAPPVAALATVKPEKQLSPLEAYEKTVQEQEAFKKAAQRSAQLFGIATTKEPVREVVVKEVAAPVEVKADEPTTVIDGFTYLKGPDGRPEMSLATLVLNIPKILGEASTFWDKGQEMMVKRNDEIVRMRKETEAYEAAMERVNVKMERQRQLKQDLEMPTAPPPQVVTIRAAAPAKAAGPAMVAEPTMVAESTSRPIVSVGSASIRDEEIQRPVPAQEVERPADRAANAPVVPSDRAKPHLNGAGLNDDEDFPSASEEDFPS